MLIEKREIEADLYVQYVDLLVAVIEQARRDADGSMTSYTRASSRHMQEAKLFLMWARTELAGILRPSIPMPRGKL